MTKTALQGHRETLVQCSRPMKTWKPHWLYDKRENKAWAENYQSYSQTYPRAWGKAIQGLGECGMWGFPVTGCAAVYIWPDYSPSSVARKEALTLRPHLPFLHFKNNICVFLHYFSLFCVCVECFILPLKWLLPISLLWPKYNIFHFKKSMLGFYWGTQ